MKLPLDSSKLMSWEGLWIIIASVLGTISLSDFLILSLNFLIREIIRLAK